MSSAYLRLLIFLPAILIPACASSSPAFLMMYSAYKLNRQGDNIQPWHTPFPIWNQSVVPCPVLTVASWPAYRFLKTQGRWSGIPPLFQNFLRSNFYRCYKSLQYVLLQCLLYKHFDNIIILTFYNSYLYFRKCTGKTEEEVVGSVLSLYHFGGLWEIQNLRYTIFETQFYQLFPVLFNEPF